MEDFQLQSNFWNNLIQYLRPCFVNRFATLSMGESIATWTSTGAAIGGIVGSIAGGVGSALGSLAGLEIGFSFGMLVGAYNTMNGWKKNRTDCWAVNCEGKNTNPLGADGPGFASGGPKFKKIEWGAF